MNLLANALGLVPVPYYCHLPILVVIISPVFSATRFDDSSHIWREAVRWGLRLVGFLFVIVLILYALASFI